jgi:hypothetical protein
LYKAPLTASVFKDFSSCYHHLSTSPDYSHSLNTPFVYVDSSGMKIVTGVVHSGFSQNGVFATSIADDGWMQMLVVDEPN